MVSQGDCCCSYLIITSLPVISNSNSNHIHEFYKNSTTSLQPLETMKKLKDIKGYVRLTLNKMPGIRVNILRLEDNWQEWELCQLADSLRRYTDRNCKTAWNPEKNFWRETLFHVRDKDQRRAYVCVYCEKAGHRSSDCELVIEISECRLILSKKKLCFNCASPKNRTFDCGSNKTCIYCKGKYHNSIYKKTSNVLLNTNDNHVIYPLVIIDIESIKYHALIDIGAGASYTPS